MRATPTRPVSLSSSFVAAALLAAVALPAVAQDAGGARLTSIRQESTSNSTRLILEASAPLAYTYFSPDPLTLVIDIPDLDASAVPSKVAVATPEVESVQVTQMARGDGRPLARLEIKLASLVPYQIYSKDRSLNLVFQRTTAVAEAETVHQPPLALVEPAPAGLPSEIPPAQIASNKPEPEQPVVAPLEPWLLQPRPAAEPGMPATRVTDVFTSIEDGSLAITVRADGRLDYRDFFLGNPDRLVIDMPGVLSPAPLKVITVGRDPVARLRVAQFSSSDPRITRLVADLTTRSPYHIVEAVDGLKILFGEGEPAGPAPLASLAGTAPPPPATYSPAAGTIRTDTLTRAPARQPLPPALVPVVLPALGPLAPALQNQDEQNYGGIGLEKGSFGAKSTYSGHPISLDFKEGDLLDIFRLFADISGLNVVVNPGVSGKVTLVLTEVPWDQALDLILKTNQLGYTLDDNVIRIARLSDLQKEEQELRKLAEEKALAGTLEVWRKGLSYAKAEELEPTIKKVALSARGSTTLDKRTNTMIITDLPANIQQARELIAELDRATPQVEIEARIVVTNRNFTRDIGVQWGFLNRQTPNFGTTTGRGFPNAIILNGQGTPSDGGVPADGGVTDGPGGSVTADEGIGLTNRGYAVNLPASSFNSSIGISLGNIIGSFNLDAALTALERQGRGRLLSTPKVTTQNNQAAEIKQGIQIPIQTVANNTVTVTFKDAVLTLKVTPQITAAGTVILALEVENNTADFANLVQGIPPINTQSAKTQVLVADGATTVIGGIYQSTEQTSVNKTPFFSKIPLLGYLFRNRFVTSNNNELLLFITPRIIKS